MATANSFDSERYKFTAKNATPYLAGTQLRHAVDKDKALYDHTKFNEAIEILIKMLDRLERFDRMFAIEQ